MQHLWRQVRTQFVKEKLTIVIFKLDQQIMVHPVVRATNIRVWFQMFPNVSENHEVHVLSCQGKWQTLWGLLMRGL